jgi:RNA polymerase sigma-70 factor, ECF subfamily
MQKENQFCEGSASEGGRVDRDSTSQEKLEKQFFTSILEQACNGSDAAQQELATIVYARLKRMARGFLRKERSGHTLQPTDLVHEAYLRLFDQTEGSAKNQKHFVALAATMMRRVLINHAVARNRQKRGSGVIHLTLGAADAEPAESPEVNLLLLDDALTELEKIDERQATVVELRYFGGLSIDETAQAMGISQATVKREWATAKLWLRDKLDELQKS